MYEDKARTEPIFLDRGTKALEHSPKPRLFLGYRLFSRSLESFPKAFMGWAFVVMAVGFSFHQPRLIAWGVLLPVALLLALSAAGVAFAVFSRAIGLLARFLR